MGKKYSAHWDLWEIRSPSCSYLDSRLDILTKLMWFVVPMIFWDPWVAFQPEGNCGKVSERSVSSRDSMSGVLENNLWLFETPRIKPCNLSYISTCSLTGHFLNKVVEWNGCSNLYLQPVCAIRFFKPAATHVSFQIWYVLKLKLWPSTKEIQHWHKSPASWVSSVYLRSSCCNLPASCAAMTMTALVHSTRPFQASLACPKGQGHTTRGS